MPSELVAVIGCADVRDQSLLILRVSQNVMSSRGGREGGLLALYLSDRVCCRDRCTCAMLSGSDRVRRPDGKCGIGSRVYTVAVV